MHFFAEFSRFVLQGYLDVLCSLIFFLSLDNCPGKMLNPEVSVEDLKAVEVYEILPFGNRLLLVLNYCFDRIRFCSREAMCSELAVYSTRAIRRLPSI